ncbi:MAG: hypothetical protein PVF85_10100, partial [Anaerolineales bacterium]
MADTRAEFTETLNKMIEVEGPVCASFFIPTHEVGGEWRGDRIQLKNLLREAQDQFRQMDLPEEDVQNLLQPVQAMLQESSTWEQMRAGLSIFTTPDRHYIIRLPFSVEPQVVIGERFHIKPTLPWLARKGRFYILALSQNLLRLFECTPEGCAQLDPSMTPTSMQDALKYDDPERRTTLHTTEVQADGPSSGGSVVFHGHGVGSDNHEERLRRYFQAAADGVEEHLAGTNAPLLIYGVEENVAMYREVSKYPHLLEAALYGNPDDKDLAEIEREANKLVQAYQERKKLKAEERLNNHRGTDKVTQD